MIVSHRHKFIYIRTRKIASTSLEIALSRVCGDSDIITPVAKRDEQLRTQLGGRPPQHWQNANGTTRFWNHMPAAEIRLLVGERVWCDYLIWSVERDPWSKTSAYYFHRHRWQDRRPEFPTFIESGAPRQVVNYPLYTIGGQLAVDRILPYHDLSAAWKLLIDELRLPHNQLGELPQAKSQFKHTQFDSELYGQTELDSIADIFACEISMFGWVFGLSPTLWLSPGRCI